MRFFPIKNSVKKRFVKNKTIFHKKDCIFITAVLFTAALSALVTALFQNGAGQAVRITIDGKLYGEYSLSDNRTIIIDEPLGYNRVVIENGTAYMDGADCPDKYCMDYKPVSKGNETIICLPHRLVVEVLGKTDTRQPDIIVQ